VSCRWLTKVNTHSAPGTGVHLAKIGLAERDQVIVGVLGLRGLFPLQHLVDVIADGCRRSLRVVIGR